jgi:hypothetical protein
MTVAQLTVPSALKRLSSNKRFPRAIFSGVWGLSDGIGTGGSPKGFSAPQRKEAEMPTSKESNTILMLPIDFPPLHIIVRDCVKGPV